MKASSSVSATSVKLVECPRDAWQGLEEMIPTASKVSYLKRLLECGFRHIDAVSFVSPRHVPQMADSEQVMNDLRETVSQSPGAEIIGIVVNEQGFQRALAAGITAIGYPYSISERFSRQNANISCAESRDLIKKMLETLSELPKAPRLVVYVSMAFGNPYGEPWTVQIAVEAVEWLASVGVQTISLADTVGRAEANDVAELLRCVGVAATPAEIGVHLHSRPDGASEKIIAAYEAGCRRFDAALTGLGGCPFAGDRLVGNIPTEIVVDTLQRRDIGVGLPKKGLANALKATQALRVQYAGV